MFASSIRVVLCYLNGLLHGEQRLLQVVEHRLYPAQIAGQVNKVLVVMVDELHELRSHAIEASVEFVSKRGKGPVFSFRQVKLRSVILPGNQVCHGRGWWTDRCHCCVRWSIIKKNRVAEIELLFVLEADLPIDTMRRRRRLTVSVEDGSRAASDEEGNAFEDARQDEEAALADLEKQYYLATAQPQQISPATAHALAQARRQKAAAASNAGHFQPTPATRHLFKSAIASLSQPFIEAFVEPQQQEEAQQEQEDEMDQGDLHQWQDASAMSQDAGFPYLLARHRLHVAALPPSLPCRDVEFEQIYNVLYNAINDNAGTCLCSICFLKWEMSRRLSWRGRYFWGAGDGQDGDHQGGLAGHLHLGGGGWEWVAAF